MYAYKIIQLIQNDVIDVARQFILSELNAQ